MATRKKAIRKKAARKKGTRKRSDSRKRLRPSKTARGLTAEQEPIPLDHPGVAGLVEHVKRAGGSAIGAYRDPLAGRPLLVASLPVKAIEPTPFQRDLSPTHTKRLAQKIDESGSFLDPLIVVEGKGGGFWTPNGRHRLAAAKVMGLRTVTALVSPDEWLAFKILPLNTEKAHNLRDRSLEVIRMARELASRRPRSREADYESEFESPALLTLGLCYEENGRFPGSAYHPFLRRVDRFASKTLRVSLRERAGWAARLAEIDSKVREIVEQLQKRGFRSPYLRTLVVARINPVRVQRGRKVEAKPAMAIGPALTRMLGAARRFDAASVRESDLALVAAVSGGGEP
jgi:ParB family chromosome partitioning protein